MKTPLVGTDNAVDEVDMDDFEEKKHRVNCSNNFSKIVKRFY